MGNGIRIALVASASLALVAQVPQVGLPENDSKKLAVLEEQLAKAFMQARESRKLPPLKWVRHLDARRRACEFAVRTAAGKSYPSDADYIFQTIDKIPAGIERQASIKADGQPKLERFAVGVWFARTPAEPEGAYFLAVQKRPNAFNDWVEHTFTDTAVLDRSWKRDLPEPCKSIR